MAKMTHEEFMAKVSYHINDEGTMTVHYGDVTLFEISECGDMTEEEISELLDTAVPESSTMYAQFVDEGEPKTYTVRYEIEIEATDPVDAALQAAEIMSDPVSFGPILDVTDPDTGQTFRIDTNEDEEALTQGDPLPQTPSPEAAMLREWADWYAEWCAADNSSDVGDPPSAETDELLKIVYRVESDGQGYTYDEILALAKGNREYAEILSDRIGTMADHIETMIEDDLREGEIVEQDGTYVLTGGQDDEEE
jgi:hypothetical protein